MMSQRNFSCALCPRVFRSIHSRNRHRREQHLASNRYSCNLCPAVFPRLTNLKRHRTRLHSIQIVLDRPTTNAASGDYPDLRDPDTTPLPDISQDILAIADMLSEMDTDENIGNLTMTQETRIGGTKHHQSPKITLDFRKFLLLCSFFINQNKGFTSTHLTKVS